LKKNSIHQDKNIIEHEKTLNGWHGQPNHKSAGEEVPGKSAQELICKFSCFAN